jgi:hypothetical protein
MFEREEARYEGCCGHENGLRMQGGCSFAAGGPLAAAMPFIQRVADTFRIPGLQDWDFGIEVTGKMPVPLCMGH